jgi:hypothetical protein
VRVIAAKGIEVKQVIAAALCAVAVTAGTASAGSGLTKAQYIARLRAANTASAKAETAVTAALGSRRSTAADVKAKFVLLGRVEAGIGREFAQLAPPRAAAKGNADFAYAELVLGGQNLAIARRLPTTKAAVMKYIRSLKPPSGGRLVDRAIAELHAAGFRI